MIMPSHAKNVKLYQEAMPLFARYQVESTLSAMFNPTVQLPSGGYIVIGVTEALVAIDINSGRATREGSIEETALRTNLEAAAEIARQLRLRDLAGLIVIDFIDMEERRNNAAVEKMLKDKLKTDRARIQVGRISGFGLLEMSRQRLRPGMLEATTQPCPHCHGTGLIRSDDTMGLTILRQIEEEGTRGRSKEVLVRAPAGAVNFLFNMKREHIAQIEARYGMAVRIEADPLMVSPDFTIEKFKTATRVANVVVPSAVVSLDASYMSDDSDDELEIEEAEDVTEAAEAPVVPAEGGEEQPRKKRRRRRRRRGGKENGADELDAGQNGADSDQDDDEADTDDAPVAATDAELATSVTEVEADTEAEDTPKPKAKAKRVRKPRAKAADTEAESAEAAPVAAGAAVEADTPAPKRGRSRRKPKAEAEAAVEVEVPTGLEAAGGAELEAEAPAVEMTPEPVAAENATIAAATDDADVMITSSDASISEPQPPQAAPVDATKVTEAATDAQSGPKRRGWWSR